jgi:hypothetical protein
VMYGGILFEITWELCVTMLSWAQCEGGGAWRGAVSVSVCVWDYTAWNSIKYSVYSCVSKAYIARS